MTAINWNPGQLITMSPGDTATCAGHLAAGQIYALFFYNAAYHARSTDVYVIGTNDEDPVVVTVPDSNANQGPAALCFVNGTDTSSVAASILKSSTDSLIQAYIGSISLPTEYPPGMQNVGLPADGQAYAFSRFTRFSATPAAHRYSCELTSDVNQFMCVQFKEKSAKIYVVNALQDPNSVIYYYKNAQEFVTLEPVKYQRKSWTFQGSGQHMVWLNADNVQDQASATISLQSLQMLYDSLP